MDTLKPPLIAIDGPAGAGKSTTSLAVSKNLGLPYLDTGALYRAATVLVKRKHIDLQNTSAITRAVNNADFTIIDDAVGTRIFWEGQELTDELRTPEVTRMVASVCEIHEVRVKLVAMQKKWALRGFGILEGRDIGTVVLPEADLKIFMTASPEIRALRRGRDLNIADDTKAMAELTAEMVTRDKRDTERSDSPLRQAKDAVLLDTSDMTFEEQVEKIIQLAGERFRLKIYGADKNG